MPRFRDLIYTDFAAMSSATPTLSKVIGALFFRPRLQAVFFYRCYSSITASHYPARFAKRLFWFLNYYLHGCEIHLEAQIGAGFNLPHPHGVTIARVTIGQNVTICQNVTIGQLDFTDIHRTPDEMPILEDGVIVFAGAVIAGRVRIGTKATVGANAVVTKDVPPHHTAVGVPARALPPKNTAATS